MAQAEIRQAQRLAETFRDYITASAAADRVYLDYMRLEASEDAVHAAQRSQVRARDAHLEAINAVAEGVTA